MIFIGIDPGLTGALAAVDSDGEVVGVLDTPSVWATTGKKRRRQYDTPEMVRAIARLKGTNAALVAVEHVGPMPKQGVTSTFSFGYGYGLWIGIATTFNLPLERPTPQRWMREMLHGMPRGKQASVLKADALFPEVDLPKSKHGRADALLIAEWARRTCG